MVESEIERVERWRAYICVEHGCTPEDAVRFAQAYYADLHKLVAMIKQGCDPTLAVSILV